MTGLRERKKHATRKAILAAARQLMIRQGFAATTMAEVAEAADVSVGSFYNYFANKNALLVGIFGDATGDILALGQGVLDDPGDDARAALTRLMHVYLDSLQQFDKGLLKETFAVAFAAPPEVLAELAGLDMKMAEQLGTLVATFQARGLITKHVTLEQASIALYGTMAVAMMMWLGLEGADHDVLHETLDQQLAVVFRGLDPK